MKPGDIVEYYRTDGAFAHCNGDIGVVEYVYEHQQRAVITWIVANKDLLRGACDCDLSLLVPTGQNLGDYAP